MLAGIVQLQRKQQPHIQVVQQVVQGRSFSHSAEARERVKPDSRSLFTFAEHQIYIVSSNHPFILFED
jgi:hypothetical protein